MGSSASTARAASSPLEQVAYDEHGTMIVLFDGADDGRLEEGIVVGRDDDGMDDGSVKVAVGRGVGLEENGRELGRTEGCDEGCRLGCV